jgi:Domain of unknown function (DUF4410)
MLRVRSRLTETRKAFGHLDCGMGNRGLRVCKEFSALVLVTIMMSGCAATVVTPQYESHKLRLYRPSRVLIYDFAVTRDQVKENRGFLQGTVNDFEGKTAYEHEGELADEVRQVAAEELVKGIQNLGLPAERVAADTPLPSGAVAITGQFLDVDEGNKAARLVVGFGKGQSKVDIRVQLYGSGAVYGSGSQGQYAPPAKLLEFGTHADSGSMPGVAVTGAAGAAIGAGVGGAMGMSRQRQAEQQYQQGVQQAGTKNQQTRETFDLAHRTCMEAKGYKS